MVERCRLRPCCRCHCCDCPAVRAHAAAGVAVCACAGGCIGPRGHGGAAQAAGARVPIGLCLRVWTGAEAGLCAVIVGVSAGSVTAIAIGACAAAAMPLVFAEAMAFASEAMVPPLLPSSSASP